MLLPFQIPQAAQKCGLGSEFPHYSNEIMDLGLKVTVIFCDSLISSKLQEDLIEGQEEAL